MPDMTRRQRCDNALSLAQRLETYARQIKADLLRGQPSTVHGKQAKAIADDLAAELRDVATIDEMTAKLGRAA